MEMPMQLEEILKRVSDYSRNKNELTGDPFEDFSNYMPESRFHFVNNPSLRDVTGYPEERGFGLECELENLDIIEQRTMLLEKMRKNNSPDESVSNDPRNIFERNLKNIREAKALVSSELSTIPEDDDAIMYAFLPENAFDFSLAPSDSYFKSKTIDNVTDNEDKDKIFAAKDKIKVREISEKLGLFNNPRYAGIGRRFREDDEMRLLDICMENVSDCFPYGEIVSDLQSERKYVFHNEHDGFSITTGNGTFKVNSHNDEVMAAYRSAYNIEDETERLKSFVENLDDYVITVPSKMQISDENMKDKLVEEILSYDKSMYLKDARTANGHLVVRIRKDDEGNSYIESDSEELENIILRKKNENEKRLEKLDNLIKTYRSNALRYSASLDEYVDDIDPMQEIEPTSFFAKNMLDKAYSKMKEKEKIETQSSYDNSEVLKELLENNMSYPILEEEIPFERIGDKTAEFRMICQYVPDDDNSMNLSINSYAKVSMNNVNVNISLGGQADSVYNVLESIYQQRRPELSREEIKEKAENAESDLETKTREFSDAMIEEYDNISIRNIKDNRSYRLKMDDFAIDVAPSWDEEKEDINFYLVEVQHGYGYSGLQSLDPDRANVVSENKEKLKNYYI